MLTPTHTKTTTNWTDKCIRCTAVIVGFFPGDITLTKERQGWTFGLTVCPRCTRAKSQQP